MLKKIEDLDEQQAWDYMQTVLVFIFFFFFPASLLYYLNNQLKMSWDTLELKFWIQIQSCITCSHGFSCDNDYEAMGSWMPIAFLMENVICLQKCRLGDHIQLLHG